MKIKKGDTVKVQVGKDSTKQGKIERIYQKQGKVLIPGVNMFKRHMKKSEQMPKGGIVDIPHGLDVAKVMFVCPKCKKTARLGYVIEKNKKYRICKKCKSKV